MRVCSASTADDNYLPGIQRLCRKYGTLFIADEIQTGLGRTGCFLAVERWGIQPDMILVSKILSGEHVSVAAVLARKWIFDKVFDRMDRVIVHGRLIAFFLRSQVKCIITTCIDRMSIHGGYASTSQMYRMVRNFFTTPQPMSGKGMADWSAQSGWVTRQRSVPLGRVAYPRVSRLNRTNKGSLRA
jgi:glutamate-1-semialdehyde aminotransferase